MQGVGFTMKRVARMFLLVFVLMTAWSPVVAMANESETLGQQASDEMGQGVAIASIRSVKLKELSAKYLENEHEEGFWLAVQKISDSGGYPFVEEIEPPDESPANYIRLTFLHREGADSPANVLLFANINHVLAEELLFEKIGKSGVYFKSVEVPRGVRFQYRILENDPLTGLFAAAKYGTRMHLLGGDPDPFNPNRKIYPDGLGEGKDYISTWVVLPGASPQPYIVDKGNESGELITEERVSTMSGYSHKIFTYLPPDYDREKEYPLLVLFDGEVYFSLGDMQLTLENLFADGSIQT